jgi:tryptophan 7-halogenase
MGIRPASPSPRVDNLDYATIEQTLRNAKAAIAGMVEHLPTHEQFLGSSAPGEAAPGLRKITAG